MFLQESFMFNVGFEWMKIFLHFPILTGLGSLSGLLE